jgi:RNA polymerase sigma factor (sigma-70 family)
MKHYSEEFIRTCSHGDRKAQKSLFEELYAPMYRVVNRYVSKQDEAEDCVMKGFMKVFQSLPRFRYEGEHSLFAWVRRIMVNEALMFLRSQHNFLLSLESRQQDIPVESEVLLRMNAEDLHALILTLPTGYRTVFNLHVVEGYEHREIAQALGISENTSRTQLAKAKSKLRILIEQKEMTHGNYGQ